MADYLPRGVPRREEELRVWLLDPTRAFREAGGPARSLDGGPAAALAAHVVDVAFVRERAERTLLNVREVLRVLKWGQISREDCVSFFCTTSLVEVREARMCVFLFANFFCCRRFAEMVARAARPVREPAPAVQLSGFVRVFVDGADRDRFFTVGGVEVPDLDHQRRLASPFLCWTAGSLPAVQPHLDIRRLLTDKGYLHVERPRDVAGLRPLLLVEDVAAPLVLRVRRARGD